MSSKSMSKTTKKRKTFSPDPTQGRLDKFLSPTKQITPGSTADDPMQIDDGPVAPPVKQARLEPNDTLYTKKTAASAITILQLNPARPLAITTEAFEHCWKTQKALILSIFSSKENKNINYVTVARMSESLCRFGKSEELYNVLFEEIQNHVQQLKTELLNPAKRHTILPRLNNSWDTFGKHLAIIRNVFMELDRTYILPSTKFASIIQLGKHVFSETIMDASEFRGVVVAEVLKLIKEDRDGLDANLPLIRQVLQMLIELSYYTTDFEPRFLTSTNNYYKEEANKLINGLSTQEYLQNANSRRQEEIEDRVRNYLDPRTKQELAFAVTNQLVFQKTEVLITKGFNQLMDKNMVQPLKIFYGLLEQSPKLNLLRNAFSAYIKAQGTALIRDPKNDGSMINTLLQFKRKLDEILKSCFNDDSLFANALKESFGQFILTRGTKPAELLAKYIDSKLKISVKKTNRNTEVDMTALDNTLVLFRLVQNRDIFEQYYKRYLSKRLLLDRSHSYDVEKHVLKKLKSECGYDFTKNLETMFKDMETSIELNSAFKEYKEETPRLPINVKVTAQATWPTYPSNNIRVPQEMAASQKLFEEFYTSKFDGRTLIWQNSLSSCSLTAQFPKGNKEIIVSLSQAVIILLFNNINTLSYSEIKSATRLDDNDLMALLKSLSSKPYELLTNGGKEKISKSDQFSINESFESQHTKIKMPPATVEQTAEEQKDVEKKVQIDRQNQLDAAIVRIMKAKKTLAHNDLLNEIFKEVNYPVDANDIKKRIESLIDKDYIARNTEDNNLYVYVS